ncbi:MAG TPA: hypothetical protein VHD85_20545 [Terracidiphilus sp.]|nr:hypothetical protein [Terracidiphilus sp.]
MDSRWQDSIIGGQVGVYATQTTSRKRLRPLLYLITPLLLIVHLNYLSVVIPSHAWVIRGE